MRRNRSIVAVVFGIAICVSRVIQADVVVPTYTTFGALPAANFNGTGIPNDAVAITTIIHGSNTITLGLTATPRYSSPSVTNNGAGDFYAQAGNDGGAPPRALWNFNYYMNISGGGTFANYTFKLLYDLDAAANNDSSTHGVFDFNAAILLFGGSGATGNVTTLQDSQNLTFSFLNTASPFITPPSPPVSFNPNSYGQYTFALQAYSGATLLGQSAIRVNAVPEPTAFFFGGMICGAVGLAFGAKKLAQTVFKK